MRAVRKTVAGFGLEATDDVIREQSYLVARGVRALAIIGQCSAEPMRMLQASTRIETLADPGAVPFVIDRGDGVAECGCAAAGWALDLYQWVIGADPAVFPLQQRERIIGLLLGYSVEAVRQFEDRLPRRSFVRAAVSPE